jgi:hypothetical protein
MPAFLLSCRHNADIQWLVYTDVDFDAGPTRNVAFKRITLAEINTRASDVFHTRTDIRGRKLADLKIAYGVLFSDDLASYDFWSPSDLDIVWGQIRRFMTDELLAQHDILSSRRNRLSGHFTLFRNTPGINRNFDLIPDVAARMATANYEHLDETELTRSLEAERTRSPRSAPRVFWREEWVPSASYQKSLTDNPDDRLWWRNGRTFRPTGAEVMYIHFHKLKGMMDTINFGVGDSPEAFSIDRRGMLA